MGTNDAGGEPDAGPPWRMQVAAVQASGLALDAAITAGVPASAPAPNVPSTTPAAAPAPALPPR